MRLLWVQQWTVLPVIVEDGAMGDENIQQSGRLLHGGQAVDPSMRQRVGEREGHLTSRTTLFFLRLTVPYLNRPH